MTVAGALLASTDRTVLVICTAVMTVFCLLASYGVVRTVRSGSAPTWRRASGLSQARATLSARAAPCAALGAAGFVLAGWTACLAHRRTPLVELLIVIGVVDMLFFTAMLNVVRIYCRPRWLIPPALRDPDMLLPTAPGRVRRSGR